MDRRLLVVGANLARAFFLAVLLVFLATGHVNVAVVLAAAFAFGTAEVFVDTTTNTLTPMLVAKPDLGIAMMNTGRSNTREHLAGERICVHVVRRVDAQHRPASVDGFGAFGKALARQRALTLRVNRVA